MPPPHDARQLVYLGRSRLHRSRANLLQTLNTVSALESIGVRARLYLPPWPRRLDARVVAARAGVSQALDLRRSPLLHPRWGFWPFVRRHRRMLRRARAVYTRTPEIALALAAASIRCHLEVHEVNKLAGGPALGRITALHQSGLIATLLPISGGAARQLIDAGADAARVVVAPSGVNVSAFAAVPAPDAAQLDRPRVLCLGRMNAQRGLAVFQAAADAGCRVTMVGDQDEAVRRDGRFEVLPFVPAREAPAWYGRCDLVLLPYQPDLPQAASMSPIKLFEAMAAGRPIIASDLPTIREVLEHERTGLLVAAGDTAAWLAAIDRLREDRALALRLGEAARRQAAQYDWAQRARTIARAIGLSVCDEGTR